MESLPIFFKLRGRPCLVIGGGVVASRKISMLLQSGAQVSVIAPRLHPELAQRVANGQISHIAQHYSVEHLQGMHLVIAATNQREVNSVVSSNCMARQLPVNVVDDLELCSFTMGALVDRNPLLIAVSSSGRAPVLARELRARLETIFPAGYGRLATLLGQFRTQVQSKFTTSRQRRRFWEQILNSAVLEKVLAGQDAVAQTLLQHTLDHADDQSAQGEVFLVGGGPGDPDLLTFRALRLMQICDVCVYDKLISQEVLQLVRRDADLIYVGKERDRHTMPQQDINALLVRLAQQGQRVLRLKGGDPFIFGRGGEEIETLMASGIPFQVVPGISAANGVAAYAGIPLTHRDYAQACLFITGHIREGKVELDWPALLRPHQTVVIYMGLQTLPQICTELMQRGMSADMPAAVVEQGTTTRQRVVVGALKNLAQRVEETNLKPPCLTIIGEVVTLREKLRWFEGRDQEPFEPSQN